MYSRIRRKTAEAIFARTWMNSFVRQQTTAKNSKQMVFQLWLLLLVGRVVTLTIVQKRRCAGKLGAIEHFIDNILRIICWYNTAICDNKSVAFESIVFENMNKPDLPANDRLQSYINHGSDTCRHRYQAHIHNTESNQWPVPTLSVHILFRTHNDNDVLRALRNIRFIRVNHHSCALAAPGFWFIHTANYSSVYETEIHVPPSMHSITFGVERHWCCGRVSGTLWNSHSKERQRRRWIGGIGGQRARSHHY